MTHFIERLSDGEGLMRSGQYCLHCPARCTWCKYLAIFHPHLQILESHWFDWGVNFILRGKYRVRPQDLTLEMERN